MGGNISVMLGGVSHVADVIDYTNTDRRVLRNTLIEIFKEINHKYLVRYKTPLWAMPKYLETGEMFSGSSRYLFDLSINDVFLQSYSPIMGDIDVMVPNGTQTQLWDLFDEYKSDMSSVEYYGNNREEKTFLELQINSLWSINGYNIQIDFEFADFLESAPTSFAKFSHFSHVDDTMNGIKGVNHKYLLRCLATASSMMDNAVIVTPKATPQKPRKKKMNKPMCMYRFSVAKGFRRGYELIELDGKKWGYPGKAIYKELATKDSVYEKNINLMFQMFFGTEPETPKELESMWSFIGLLNLMSKYLSDTQIIDAFSKLCNLYWGEQCLVRNDPEADKTIKLAGYKAFNTMFSEIVDPVIFKVHDLQEEFYSKYRMD